MSAQRIWSSATKHQDVPTPARSKTLSLFVPSVCLVSIVTSVIVRINRKFYWPIIYKDTLTSIHKRHTVKWDNKAYLSITQTEFSIIPNND